MTVVNGYVIAARRAAALGDPWCSAWLVTFERDCTAKVHNMLRNQTGGVLSASVHRTTRAQGRASKKRT